MSARPFPGAPYGYGHPPPKPGVMPLAPLGFSIENQGALASMRRSPHLVRAL
ncbi:hypothetical protein [Streptomyces sp. NPDC088557]|uniref:hypothetical protein n=1 Tax=Streptomyces sp. NPDC088557 TaxID=3365867 RepID=UPI0037F13A05